MDDKWFGDLCIVLGRSWTGKHIYILPIVPHADGWLVREILVIGSFGGVRTEAEHVQLVERILSRWLTTEMPGEG